MNEGQERFFNFILERALEGKQEEARALMNESFEKQAQGAFTKEYAMAFMPRMLALLKPEHVEEVKGIMMQYGGGN